jgi:hypothetical protein
VPPIKTGPVGSPTAESDRYTHPSRVSTRCKPSKVDGELLKENNLSSGDT